MLIFLMHYLAIPLVLTIITECIVSFVLGKRGTNRVLAVIAVNLATNPAVNFIIYLLWRYLHVSTMGHIIIVLEIVVVIAEWLIYLHIFEGGKMETFVYSLLLNASSYLVGVLLL